MDQPVYRCVSIPRFAWLRLCNIPVLCEGSTLEGRYYAEYPREVALKALALFEGNREILLFFDEVNKVKRYIHEYKKENDITED